MADFSQYRQRRPAPKGGLARDLAETKKDIRAAKRGEETEASLPEMRETKRRIRQEIRDEVLKERAAKLQEIDPLQVPREKPKDRYNAMDFKIKPPSGIAGARG